MRSPFGLALYEHRGPILGWLTLAVILMAAYGGLTKEVIAALEVNPDLTDFLGSGGGEQALDQIEAMFVQMLTMLAAALVIQAIGSPRKEGDTGRLEMRRRSQPRDLARRARRGRRHRRGRYPARREPGARVDHRRRPVRQQRQRESDAGWGDLPSSED